MFEEIVATDRKRFSPPFTLLITNKTTANAINTNLFASILYVRNFCIKLVTHSAGAPGTPRHETIIGLHTSVHVCVIGTCVADAASINIL